MDYFKANPDQTDALHKELAKMSPYHARLQAIRQASLTCCGATEENDGSVSLVVVDRATFDQLQAERVEIETRLAMIDRLIKKLDAIFADAEKLDTPIHRKTPAGIRAAEVSWRATCSHRQTDDFGRPLPTPGNPELLALVARAEEAMSEAGLAI